MNINFTVFKIKILLIVILKKIIKYLRAKGYKYVSKN